MKSDSGKEHACHAVSRSDRNDVAYRSVAACQVSCAALLGEVGDESVGECMRLRKNVGGCLQ